MLTRALVNKSSRNGKHYRRRWDGKLTANEEKLLQQHALLNGLNDLQLSAMLVKSNTVEPLYSTHLEKNQSVLNTVVSSWGVAIERFHCIQTCPHGGVGIEGSTVYRDVLITGCGNRGIPLYTEVSSWGGFGIEGFHCIMSLFW